MPVIRLRLAKRVPACWYPVLEWWPVQDCAQWPMRLLRQDQCSAQSMVPMDGWNWTCTRASFYQIVPLFFSRLRPSVHKLLCDSGKFFVWETSHTCTSSVTCWSLAKGRPLKASLSVPKRWKSEVNRSPLYGGCSNTLKFSYQRVSMYGLQCVDAQCRATMQQLLTVAPSDSIK